jgi:hypothetical protein
MTETDVVRRLADVATTTGVDPDAWLKIRARITDLPPAPARRHVPRRLVLAVAAALIVVLGMAAILARGDGDRVRTVDDPTTTLDPHPTTPDRRRTTTTSPSAGTSLPEGGAPAGDAPSTAVAGSSGTDRGRISASPTGTGTGSGSGPPTSAPAGPTDTTRPSPPAPTRLSPMGVVSSTQGFDVELVYSANTLYIRRTDDVGSVPGPPDGYGYLDAVTWGDVSGASCLTWGGNAYMFPGATQPEVVVFGVVSTAVTQFLIVMGDGTPFGGAPGPIVEPGLRVWFANLPDGPIDHIEARDAANTLVASIANPSAGVPTAVQC